jgi:hypothetical protein
MTLSSTSGSIAVVGALDPSGDHRAESISGSVELTPLNGVTAELRAISGSIVSNVEHKLEGSRGHWRSIVGDGHAIFKVNSTSGGLHILAPRPSDYVVAPAAPAPSAPPASGSGEGPAATTEEATAAGTATEQSVPQETEETWSPDETGEADGAPDEDEELAVLQALERGEIGVDEAAERLERSRR